MSTIAAAGLVGGDLLDSESAATGILTAMPRKLGACAPNGKGKLPPRHNEPATFTLSSGTRPISSPAASHHRRAGHAHRVLAAHRRWNEHQLQVRGQRG